MAELVLENISKAYGDFLAVKHMNLSVGKGEFVTLLGPSGCGKSTTLQMIAGLEKPTDGDIAFQGRTISSSGRNVFIEPEQRGFGVVFQSYALWPHMTVRQNLAFPLKVRRIARAERERRIEEALALVGLSGLGERYPGQLSGGQQQRVGLARAVV
jgi:ABC-type Fe3+/spermidine/putrescine transport system ATPase subunit